jgi:outer membrane protein with beta-barrel domain
MAIALVAAMAPAALAQSRQVIRGDAAGTFGWLAVTTRSSEPYHYHDWAHSLFGAGSVGWHWTDNLKSEIDFGVGTEAHSYDTTQVTTAGRVSYVSTQSQFARRTLGLSQQYQFFHNTWFHPHLAAGANLSWERRTDEIGPIYAYDDVTRTTRLVELVRTEGPRTSFTVNPFVAVGFKAYLTERTFFRNDVRVAFHNGVSETVLRLGFGVDF